jgi:hypothetical protein
LNPNLNADLDVPCNGATTLFSWTGSLYPSTYAVSVSGGDSNLPPWSVPVLPSFVVDGPKSNVALDIQQLPPVNVSGVVTLNGAQPTSQCTSSSRATVQFRSALNPNLNADLDVPCDGATTAFHFAGSLYPGDYAVSVKGGDSNLPGWSVAVVDLLRVP